MEPFGDITKTMLLKHESHKLHHEFEVDALKATITFAGDLVASNVVNGMVNGVAIAPVTWVDTHDNMMDAIVAAIEALTTQVSSGVAYIPRVRNVGLSHPHFPLAVLKRTKSRLAAP